MMKYKKFILAFLLCGFASHEARPMSSQSRQVALWTIAGTAIVAGATVLYDWWTYDAEEEKAFKERLEKIAEESRQIKEQQEENRKATAALIAQQQEEKVQAEKQEQRKIFKNRKTWSDSCRRAPFNITDGINPVVDSLGVFGKYKDVAGKEFFDTLTVTYNLIHGSLDERFFIGSLSDPCVWVDEKAFTRDGTFKAYVQKLDVNPGDKVIFHGDFHGDIHSFITELDDLESKGYLKPDSFELARDDIYLVFLGDYVDRGFYGAEVIYTLCRLKQANPDRVFMVRGNHEDGAICENSGFGAELHHKFNVREADKRQENVYYFYDAMPVALYVGHGDNYLQCCHGGIEHGYLPGKLFAHNKKFEIFDHMYREQACRASIGIDDGLPAGKDAVYKVDCKIKNCQSLGFLWGDFVKFGQSMFPVVCDRLGRVVGERGLAADEQLTWHVLAYQNRSIQLEGGSQTIHGIFRAHQHAFEKDATNPTNLMSELIESKGVYKLWRPIETGADRSLVDGLVWTFNVAPSSPYGQQVKYGFDAYAELTVQISYEDWRLKVCNTRVVDGQGDMGLT